MSGPRPSLSLLSLQAGDGNAITRDELLQDIRRIAREESLSNCSNISDDEKRGLEELISSLTESFLMGFPTVSNDPWSVYAEKIAFCEASCRLVEGVASRLREMFVRTDDFSLLVLGRLFVFMNSLNSWPEDPEPEPQTTPSPAQLHKLAGEAAVAVLKCFQSVPSNGSNGALLGGPYRTSALQCLDSVTSTLIHSLSNLPNLA